MLKIGIQKSGRISEESIKILKKIGFKFSLEDQRQLFVNVENFSAEILFLRSKEIPKYVRENICDLGLVGKEVVFEQKEDVRIVKDLNFGQCRISLAIPKKSAIRSVKDLKQKTIATSYPNILLDFLKKNKIKAEIMEMNGSVELAPALEIGDAIFDIVSSGTTLQSNGLKELQTVFQSEVVMIQNTNIQDSHKIKNIESILLRIESVIQGEKTKYIMMNAYEKDIAKLKTILPSIKSPTIVPLVEKDLYAIHSAVPAKDVWTIVEKLKENGAFSILISSIENIFL